MWSLQWRNECWDWHHSCLVADWALTNVSDLMPKILSIPGACIARVAMMEYFATRPTNMQGSSTSGDKPARRPNKMIGCKAIGMTEMVHAPGIP
mmetsp:Transcript_39633/g.71056  ORF Transcript_39633/g.71056 Transcript_39633/m.71056 type:complete len:94 (+) Transcript_39633:113-394(+)